MESAFALTDRGALSARSTGVGGGFPPPLEGGEGTTVGSAVGASSMRTSISYGALITAPAAFSARTTKRYVPALVGVPASCPPAVRSTPGGSEPPASLKDGAGVPVATKANAYGSPTRASLGGAAERAGDRRDPVEAERGVQLDERPAGMP